MNNRLPLILLLFLWLCSGPPVFAQNTGNLPLVGVLRINTPDNVEPFPTIFRNALAALGRVEGHNIRIELRLAEGHAERFPELAQALVREKASVIVASGDAAVRAAQQATQTIPIVALVDDIVAAGLINNLTKPGGNTTGVSILSSELDAKRLEFLKQLVPSGRRFAVLRDPASASARPQLLPAAARALGVELQSVDVRSPAEFASAFASFQAGGADAVNVLSSPLLFGFRTDLCSLSITYKLPTIGQAREMAEAGCLASYGISFSEFYATAAKLTDKLLKGARADETPAEQPTKFELVVNQQTARALGLEIAPLVLARADEVIE
jgi:putative tryptophan/tyrosine transport system substrate-binding protein